MFQARFTYVYFLGSFGVWFSQAAWTPPAAIAKEMIECVKNLLLVRMLSCPDFSSPFLFLYFR